MRAAAQRRAKPIETVRTLQISVFSKPDDDCRFLPKRPGYTRLHSALQVLREREYNCVKLCIPLTCWPRAGARRQGHECPPPRPRPTGPTACVCRRIAGAGRYRSTRSWTSGDDGRSIDAFGGSLPVGARSVSQTSRETSNEKRAETTREKKEKGNQKNKNPNNVHGRAASLAEPGGAQSSYSVTNRVGNSHPQHVHACTIRYPQLRELPY